MQNNFKFNIAYVLIATLLIIVFQELWTAYRTIERIPYSQFMVLLDENKLSDIVVRETTVTGTLKEPIDGHEQFVTERVEPGLADTLREKGVEFTGGSESNFLGTILSWVMPILFFFGIWYFVMRPMMRGGGLGGMMNVGK